MLVEEITKYWGLVPMKLRVLRVSGLTQMHGFGLYDRKINNRYKGVIPVLIASMLGEVITKYGVLGCRWS